MARLAGTSPSAEAIEPAGPNAREVPVQVKTTCPCQPDLCMRGGGGVASDVGPGDGSVTRPVQTLAGRVPRGVALHIVGQRGSVPFAPQVPPPERTKHGIEPNRLGERLRSVVVD